MSGRTPGRVFISYRRRQTSGLAGRLADRLAARFGDDHVFMDVDTIALGVDFAEVITQEVSTCEVLLAVIGPGWLTTADEAGRRRLDDPDDFVRLEIAAALERDIRVIPILIEGATMPHRKDLPDNLAGLARRNALNLRHENFHADVERLIGAIEPILHPPAAATSVAVGPTRVAPTPISDVAGLIQAGESQFTEFRLTARANAKTERADKSLTSSIVKVVAGFFNAHGGTLLIGVSDSGAVTGLQHDLKTLGQRPTLDGYELFLRSILNTRLGRDRSAQVKVEFASFDEEMVAVVKVPASDRPVFVRDGTASNFYVRIGNTTQMLDIEEAHNYITTRFQK